MANKCRADKSRGFTLIELLVVIAIIGALSAIVLASLSTARANARNARKESDLHEVSTALQTYFVDNGSGPANSNPGAWSSIGASLPILVTQGYISKLPVSPDGTTYYYYNYGTFLILAGTLEPPAYGPGASGYHCSDAWGGSGTSKYYCLNIN